MPRRKRPETNVELVTRIMEFSKYGPLAQVFVIDALVKWSDIVAKSDPRKADSPMISGEAWIAVAKEIQEKLAERMK